MVYVLLRLGDSLGHGHVPTQADASVAGSRRLCAGLRAPRLRLRIPADPLPDGSGQLYPQDR